MPFGRWWTAPFAPDHLWVSRGAPPGSSCLILMGEPGVNWLRKSGMKLVKEKMILNASAGIPWAWPQLLNYTGFYLAAPSQEPLNPLTPPEPSWNNSLFIFFFFALFFCSIHPAPTPGHSVGIFFPLCAWEAAMPNDFCCSPFLYSLYSLHTFVAHCVICGQFSYLFPEQKDKTHPKAPLSCLGSFWAPKPQNSSLRYIFINKV